MKVRVLIVDDSKFFRRRVAEIINAHPNLEVIGAAENGQEAVRLAAQLKPDVITMDIEMPVMTGIEAVRRIMAQRPTPIVMFSSLTSEGAKATFEALEAGAADFLPKRFEDIAKDKEQAKKLLCDKVHMLGSRGYVALRPRPRPVARVAPMAAGEAKTAPVHAPVPVFASRAPSKGNVKLIAIGASTGGPVALQKVLTALPENLPVPIVVVQHMPGTFTPAFSQRLDQACKIHVKEAEDGDVLKPGWVYISPGGRQTIFDARAAEPTLRVVDGDASLIYKPSVDATFNSIGDKAGGKVLAIILTGMGADGREGVRKLKQNGAEVWVQDQNSCVIYGMPSAVADAGLADHIYDIGEIGSHIVHKVM